MAALPGRPQHRHRPRRRVGAGERRPRPRSRDEPASVGQPRRRRDRTGSPGGLAQRRARRRSPCAAAGTPGWSASRSGPRWWPGSWSSWPSSASSASSTRSTSRSACSWSGPASAWCVSTSASRPRRLAHELRDALADVPRFLAAPLIRRRHLRWGATDDEVAATLLGDDRHHQARLRLHSCPHDRSSAGACLALARPGRTRTCGVLQRRPARQRCRAQRPGRSTTSCSSWTSGSGYRWPNASPRARRSGWPRCGRPHELLWRKPDSTWAWRLTPTDTGGTRLVTRIRATHDRRHLGSWLSSLLLLELGDYAMQRRMLLHLRERAERPVDVRASAGGAP